VILSASTIAALEAAGFASAADQLAPRERLVPLALARDLWLRPWRYRPCA
jgi:hypothetical protein